LRIGSIILAAFDIRLDVLRRHHPHPVPEPRQLACPVMRAAAGLKANQRRLERGKKPQNFLASELAAQNDLLLRIHPMQLKKMLRRIHANAAKILHGRLPCLRSPTTSFWHIDAVGGRPHHQPAFPATGGLLRFARNSLFVHSAADSITAKRTRKT
jgi:hypothetical protein